MRFKNILFLLLFMIATDIHNNQCTGAHLYPEKTYQTVWCEQQGGQAEVSLYDRTRVDCVLPEYAIEFDFANKWSEAIGQSLYYSYITKKKAGIVLIIENKARDLKYLNRLSKVADLHGITVWTIEPDFIKQNCDKYSLSSKENEHP